MINGDYRGQNASVIKHNQSALGDKPATYGAYIPLLGLYYEDDDVLAELVQLDDAQERRLRIVVAARERWIGCRILLASFSSGYREISEAIKLQILIAWI